MMDELASVKGAEISNTSYLGRVRGNWKTRDDGSNQTANSLVRLAYSDQLLR